MESQPQNPEFRNNPENFHPYCSKFIHTLENCTLNLRKSIVSAAASISACQIFLPCNDTQIFSMQYTCLLYNQYINTSDWPRCTST